MENIYRRETGRNARGRRGKERDEKERPLAIRQAVVCAILLAGALVVKTAPSESVRFAKDSISYILKEETDWKGSFEALRGFLAKEIFRKEETEHTADALLHLIAPSEGEILSGFGKRTGADGMEEFHYGLDFSAESGEKIRGVAEGIAKEVGFDETYGNYILIEHENGLASFYAHCETVLPKLGDSIGAGQVIATAGMSGTADKPMLHFEIRDGESSIDPTELLKSDTKRQAMS